jgi:predicted MPP superfamily phosphohydrolase
LGNHDSILMVPELESMGIRVLLNESVAIRRAQAAIHLAGIDDAHYYRADDIPQARCAIPSGAVSILLSHTPEIFRQAAQAGFDVLLCGHTHGGQVCLPGGIPLTIDSDCPRRLAAGPWRHGAMQGYTSRGTGTSIVEVRLNCPPEITLHRLVRQR